MIYPLPTNHVPQKAK